MTRLRFELRIADDTGVHAAKHMGVFHWLRMSHPGLKPIPPKWHTGGLVVCCANHYTTVSAVVESLGILLIRKVVGIYRGKQICRPGHHYPNTCKVRNFINSVSENA
jgi:hypothetical protein